MKKKLLLFAGLLAGTLACGFTACASNGNGDSGNNSKPVEDVVVINEFDHYDDAKMFAIDTQAFSGALRVNENGEYIKSGRASLGIYFQSIGANNPYLPVYASNLGISNITNVKSFGVYINNPGAPFTFGFVAKDAAGNNVYSKFAEVASGENDVELITDMEILQYIGKAIYSYELQFIGVTSGSTVYLDELYAVTTTKAVEPIKEIDNVVSAISNLDTSNKEEVYRVYEQYKALKNEYKVAVGSYRVLKRAVDEFYMDDLTTARLENPETLLFFNEPFGEAQIADVTSNITTSYSTEWAAEGETGSLKIEARESSINWLSVRTTAQIDVESPYIRFTVFNDSDQRKIFTLNWKGEWILPANSAVTIVCKSTWLTRDEFSGLAGGYMHYCGLVGDTWAGESPKGSIYVSAIKTFVPNPELQALRVGEDVNTLFFFDKEAGEDMLTNASEGLTYTYTTEKAFGDEEGSLKMSFGNIIDQSTVDFITAGYVFNPNDYVRFNIYNDTRAVVQFMVDYRDGIRLKPGKWTEVLIPAEEFDNYFYFRFWSIVGNLRGDVYFSKAKVISGEGIEVLSDKARNEEWTFGNLNLRGALAYENYSLALDGSQTLTNPLGYAPYLSNGELYMNFMEYPFGRIYFNLKDGINMAEDTYLELTVKNDERLENMRLHGVDSMGEWVYNWLYYEEKIDLGNGYTKYLYCLSANPAIDLETIVVQPIGEMSDNDAMQFVMKDMRIYSYEESKDAGWNENSVADLRNGVDEKTLVFANLEAGVKEQFYRPEGLDVTYDDTMAYETEEGSLKAILLPDVSGQSTLKFKLFGATYNTGDRVLLNVYVDRETSMYLFFGWENQVKLMPGQWNKIMLDAATFFNNKEFRFYQEDGNKATTVYISKITLFNVNEELESLRTGDDENTALFFDREFGADVQVGSTGNVTYEYTTEKAYGTETGSLKVSNFNIGDWSADAYMYYDVLGLQYNENDWVVLHAYLENAEKPMVIMSAYGGAYVLKPGVWTQIAIPAKEFIARYFTFYKYFAGNSGDEIIYMGKAYLTDSVVDLSGYTENDTYKLGETTFKKAPSLNNGALDESLFATMNGDPLAMSPRLIDGELVVTRCLMEKWAPFMWLFLDKTIEVSAGDVKYITIDYYDSVTLSTMYFNESESYALSLYETIDLGNGYKRNVYKMVAGKNGTLTNLRMDCGETGQFRIKNIAISDVDPT